MSITNEITATAHQLIKDALFNQMSYKRVKCHFSPCGFSHFASLVQKFHFSPVGPKRFHRCHFSPLG
ncbi:hypothetical protein Hanom_Chr10g00952541 [Helianthus anomalus]